MPRRDARFWRAASLSLAVLLAALSTAIPSGGAALVALLQVEATPTPATSLPGTSGVLTLNLRNLGNATIVRLETHVSQAPSEIRFESPDRVDVGALGPGDGTRVSPFAYRVPADTPPGFYRASLSLSYTYLTGPGTQTSSGLTTAATIVVRAAPALTLQDLSPAQFQPGDEAQATVRLVNGGNATFANFIATWTTPQQTLLALGGSNRIHVPTVPTHADLRLPLHVGASTSAAPGLYPISFQFTYHDEAGTLFEGSSVLGVRIGGATTFAVSIQNLSDDRLTLAVTNVGLTPVSGVQVRLLAHPRLALEGGDTVSFVALPPGAFATAGFDVQRRDRGADDLWAVVAIAYTDSLGQRQVQNATVNLARLAAPADATTLIAWTIAIVLASEVVLAGATLGLIHLRKRRRETRDAARDSQPPDRFSDLLRDVVEGEQLPAKAEPPRPPPGLRRWR